MVLSYEKWLTEEGSELLRSDVRQILAGDEHQTDLVSLLLLRESWGFKGGVGDYSDDWSREIHTDVRIAKGTRSADDLVQARDKMEYPTPVPITEPESSPQLIEQVVGLWGTVSNHPVGAVVVTGLLVAAVLAAVKALG